ncbi:MAG: hypothetical protein EA405_13695 [Rhodospirillales bacterium]|nr:MAG: hypothetical protein EA405_13695 [Rhodospirillales bacterium]
MPVDFAAADVAVLPYTAAEGYMSFLNSGAALLGLSFDKPLLTPAMGSIIELSEMLGDDWVRTYEGAFDERVLADAVAWLGQCAPTGPAPLDAYDWEVIAAKTVQAYQALATAQ